MKLVQSGVFMFVYLLAEASASGTAVVEGT